MTLQTQHTANAPATLTDEQRRRVADALENAQSENTRRNYAGQYRKFRDWCEREKQSALPASPEVVAAYAAELVAEGKSMPTVRLALSAIVDAHKRVGLESPQTAGVSETLRGLSRQVGVSQKQARPLDADALAAIRATALNPRKSRGGSLEMEETALRRGRFDIALASVLSDAGLRISEAADLRWRDVFDAEDGAGLVYIERSKTDQAGEGAYVVVTPDTLAALKQLREDSGSWADDDSVFGLSMSQISRRVDSMAKAAGLGDGYTSHSGRVGLTIRMTRRGAPLQAVQTHVRWKSPSMPARRGGTSV
jgi:integrase